MRVWTERQGELRGHYEINLAATALLQLLALRHRELAAVQARSPADTSSHNACLVEDLAFTHMPSCWPCAAPRSAVQACSLKPTHQVTVCMPGLG